MEGVPVIDLRGLRKVFRDVGVLDGLSLTVHPGEMFVVMGRSGCGKSVLLKHMLGLLEPDQGEVWIQGVCMGRLSVRERYELRLKFGMLFQGAALFDSLTVFDNVAFGLVEHTTMTPKEIALRVEECLEQVGLEGQGRQLPQELSGGMRKRVGLARAVAMKPQILLYDEPTTGLDPLTADSIVRLVVQLKSVLKVTSVVVTHDTATAFRIADRLGFLHEGRIREVGRPEEFRRSEDPVIRDFLSCDAAS